MIRRLDGRIKGPYTTDQVLRRIRDGRIQDEVDVSPYPGGNWYPISQEIKFYDEILKLLESDFREQKLALTKSQISRKSNASSKASAREIDAISSVPEPSSPAATAGYSTASVEDVSPSAADNISSSMSSNNPGTQPIIASDVDIELEVPVKASSRTKRPNMNHDQDIELVDHRAQVDSQLRPLYFKLVGFVAVVFVLAWLLTGNDIETKVRRIRLEAPSPNAVTFSTQEVDEWVKKGLAAYQIDNLQGYLLAQTHFIKVLEANPKLLPVAALLCMVHLELWPYSDQTLEDIDAVKKVNQLASLVAPGGTESETCRTVDLFLQSREEEADQIISAILAAFSQSQEPPTAFYYLKALFMDYKGKFEVGLGYLNSAQALWPSWLRPFSKAAELKMKLNQPEEAAKILRAILSANPQHWIAQVNLGQIEINYLRQYQLGENRLRSVLPQVEQLPRKVAARLYYELAKLDYKANQIRDAQRLARLGYEMDPDFQSIRELLVQMGGEDEISSIRLSGRQLQLMGDQYQRRGDCHSAQAHYKSAFEANPKNAVAAMQAGNCLWKLGFSNEAIEWLNKSIQADSKLISAYTTLANFYAKKFNYDDAYRVLAKVKSFAPKSHEVMRGYAQVQMSTQDYEGAVSWAQQALALNHRDVESVILIAEAQLKMGRAADAYQAAVKATELDINNTEAQQVFAKSLVIYQGAQVAKNHIEQLIKKYPAIVGYRQTLAEILYQNDEFDEAIEMLNSIIRLQTRPKEAYLYLGRVFAKKGNLAQATSNYNQAALADPGDAQPFFEMGVLYYDLGKSEEAIDLFEKVLKINERFPLAHYYIGRAALRLRRPQQALEEAKTEISANPRLSLPWALKAEAHFIMKDYFSCVSSYLEAIQIAPQGASEYLQLSRCYQQTGNLDLAAQMLEKAGTFDGGNPQIWREMGYIYMKKNENNRAIKAFDRYLILDPGAPDAQQIEMQIRILGG